MKIQHLSIILFIVLIVFSLSAVSATNETVTDDVNLDNAVVSDDGNASHVPQEELVIEVGNTSVDYGYANSGASSPIELPKLEVSLKSDENNSFVDQFVDISINYGDYSLDINNENYFFTLNQNFGDNPIYNQKKIMDVNSLIKNNNLVLNVNFLNMTNQTMELNSSDNFLNNFLNMIISFFNSLFN